VVYGLKKGRKPLPPARSATDISTCKISCWHASIFYNALLRKFTESTNIQKATTMHWNKGKWQAVIPVIVHWEKQKSDKTCTQGNTLAAFPLTTATDKHR